MPVMDDPEMRALFSAELAERSARLVEAAQLARSGTATAGDLEMLRREAHTIKGTSRMMGFEAIGAAGEAGWPIQVGGRPCRIAGVLKTSGHNDRSLADSAMNTLVIAITDLIDSGKACAWIDDRDQSGSSLQIVGFRRIGPRRYTRDGADWGVWYEYQCDLIELSGAGRQ